MTQASTLPDTLSEIQLLALRNLAERQPGQDSNFVNIAAAQRLTSLGLARHGGGGWEITPLGRNRLLHTHDTAASAANAR